MLRVTGRAAGVAQLAEHNVANVVVVGSNPITRSNLLVMPYHGTGDWISPAEMA